MARATPPPPRHSAHLFTTPFALCLAFRACNAAVVRTFFNADEFWQGPEVAHFLAYGYGERTWEWRADVKLRGYAHPLLYAAMYRLGDALGARSAWFTRNAPRAAHATLAALHDVGCARLARRLYGADAAAWTLALRLINWFVFFCETRSFVNCVEAVCVTWALTTWPFERLGSGPGGAARRVKSLCFAALACVMRPTSAMVFAPLALRTLWIAKEGRMAKMRYAFAEALGVGCVAAAASASVDRYFYGEWTCVVCNFVKFNVLSNGSALYGSHPWHWYVTQGYPAVMGTMTPLALVGFWRHRATCPEAFIVTFWTIVGYSIAAHKEFRFLLPCMSASLASAGAVLATMQPRRRRVVVAGIALTNVVAAAYTSIWHQAGTIAVMPYITNLADRGEITAGGVLFATPCHQTPYYSHVHREIAMHYLECAPRDDGSIDASDRFGLDPDAYLSETYGASPRAHDAHACAIASALAPSHVVVFDGDAERASAWLARWNFTLQTSFHHAHVAVDRDIQRRLNVYARSASDTDACDATT